MVQAFRLTSFSHGAGCACKLGPRDLTRVLDLLGPTTKPQDVLVSEETGDDAAVYRLADGTGLVLTLDFFTPLVDDPSDWDRIAASKPIGTGLITTAIKRGRTDVQHVRLAVDTMTALNADAAAAMVSAGAAAATDVTGFGLLGHLRKMLEASGCAAIVDAGSVPLLPSVLDLARRDIVAGGTKRNHAWLQEVTAWGDLTTPEQIVLADAQTSGGLLVAAHGSPSTRLFTEIGEVVAGSPGSVSVTGRVRE